MAKLKSDHVALFSLAVAALSTAFAIYQWWSSGREERVRAAIDLSVQYVESGYMGPFFDQLMRAVEIGNVGPDQAAKATHQLERAKYVAYLANRGLVNPNYLSQYLVCDIVRLSKDDNNEAKEFERTQHATCNLN